MARIVSVKEAIEQAKGLNGKVVVGGCFDILHLGHITFLESAKNHGNNLFVLLESDASIRKLKGPDRPINNQDSRARVLAALSVVDFVVLLPEMHNQDYDSLIWDLNPEVIAVTEGDKGLEHKRRQSDLVGAKLVEATPRIKQFSTTHLIDLKSV